MGGAIPIGLDWPSIYPLIDKLAGDAWIELHDDLAVMEHEAIKTKIEFEPKQKNQ